MTARAEQFGRIVYLTIGREGQEGKRFSGLRVEFDVSMTPGGKPNAAKITAHNLTAASVADLKESDAYVRLEVGYEREGSTRTIFVGNPVPRGVADDRTPARVVTKIEAADGARAYRRSRIEESFDEEVGIVEVVDRCVEASGLSRGVIDLPDTGVRFPAGLVLEGSVASVLDEVTLSAGAEWTIRDGAVYVMPKDAPTGEPAIVFSSQGSAPNLIGSPVKLDRGVEIVGLLGVGAASMRPGRLFEVRSKRVNGVYRARSVQFVGNSDDGPFYAKIKGRPH